MNNWYVITGGPSTGKSTLLDELSKLGHKTLPEAAREIIDEGLKSGKTLEEIRKNEKTFQRKVLDHKINTEKILPKEVQTFLDRGIHDTLAYLQLKKIDIEENVFEAVKNADYKKVFLLDPLDTYNLDYARTETQNEAIKLNELLYKVFANHGLRPIRVPVLSPADRAKFVLRHID